MRIPRVKGAWMAAKNVLRRVSGGYVSLQDEADAYIAMYPSQLPKRVWDSFWGRKKPASGASPRP